MWSNAQITVHPSHDIWACGMLAYEAVTQTRVLTSQSLVTQCAQGHAPYPWEVEAEQQPRVWLQSRLRAVMLPCLQREPAARPTAEQLYGSLSRLGHCSVIQ